MSIKPVIIIVDEFSLFQETDFNAFSKVNVTIVKNRGDVAPDTYYDQLIVPTDLLSDEEERDKLSEDIFLYNRDEKQNVIDKVQEINENIKVVVNYVQTDTTVNVTKKKTVLPKVLVIVPIKDDSPIFFNKIKVIEEQLYGNKFVIRMVDTETHRDLKICDGFMAVPQGYISKLQVTPKITYTTPENLKQQLLKPLTESEIEKYENKNISVANTNMLATRRNSSLFDRPSVMGHRASVMGHRPSVMGRASVMGRPSEAKAQVNTKTQAPAQEKTGSLTLKEKIAMFNKGGSVTRKRTVFGFPPVYRPKARRVSLRTVR